MNKFVNKLIVLIICILLITGCKDKRSDAQKFKEEYESLNNKYENVLISIDNPFVYKEASEIVDMIKDKKTFVVYFGYSKCNDCRILLNTLIESVASYQLDTIYYVDIENIRDIYNINSEGAYKEKDGTEGYNKLLSILDSSLSDYMLSSVSGEIISIPEKRIYEPTVIGIINGSVNNILQYDGNEEVEDLDIVLGNIIEPVVEELNSCNIYNKGGC